MTKPIDHLSEAEWLELVRQAAAMSDAPAAWVSSAVQLWHTHAPAAAGPPAPAPRRWFAVLTFDSWAAPALAGGMRMLTSEVRHLLFTAHGRDIDLRIAPLAETYAISGQLLGPNGEGQVVLGRIAPAATAPAPSLPVHVAALDELGEFRLEGVGQGTYLLTLRLQGDEVVLPPIAIGPPAGAGA